MIVYISETLNAIATNLSHKTIPCGCRLWRVSHHKLASDL